MYIFSNYVNSFMGNINIIEKFSVDLTSFRAPWFTLEIILIRFNFLDFQSHIGAGAQ